MNLEIIHVGLLGTNCYVSWDEDKNCVVVDCGGDADKVADFIREKGLTPTHLLLTHGHGDHMGGAAELKEIFPQIKIVLGKRDLEMIGDGEKSMSNAVAPYAKPFTPDILVKEGDRVKAGQVLARLDPDDVQKEVEIAQNAYDLASANLDEAQREAKKGYAEALQEQQAVQRDYDRKAVLFAGGDISQAEMEAAADSLNSAKRKTASFYMENGEPAAEPSFRLQVKNAEFELEQKKERLEETEVTSPIDGTVVRVNSRVGRFADMVDDDKPLFAIDNLDNLEMKISVSEYSIGKVKLGQEAEITADILNGQTERGVITAISPTGEEKGGGSTERVIPTTIRIQNTDTALIAGITARARIVLNRAANVWVVPVSAIIEREDGTWLAAAEAGKARLIPVEKGVEGDVSAEISGDGLSEGLNYLVTPDPALQDGTAVTAVSQE